MEEFPCLVHKLSVILTAQQYKPQNGEENIQTAAYNDARTVCITTAIIYEISLFITDSVYLSAVY